MQFSLGWYWKFVHYWVKGTSESKPWEPFWKGIGSWMSLLCLCKCLHPLGKIESWLLQRTSERKAVSNMLRRYFRGSPIFVVVILRWPFWRSVKHTEVLCILSHIRILCSLEFFLPPPPIFMMGHVMTNNFTNRSRYKYFITF